MHTRNCRLMTSLGAVLWAAAMATAIGCATAQAAEPVTYVEILHQLTDLDRLTRLQTGCAAGIFSSWDRNSKSNSQSKGYLMGIAHVIMK